MTMSIQEPGAAVEDLDRLTELFHLLSDKTRLNILVLLSRGERNVSSLCEELGQPQPTVSHHLGLLRMNRLVANRRAGKQIYYGLDGRTDVTPGAMLKFKAGELSVRIAAEDTAAGAS